MKLFALTALILFSSAACSHNKSASDASENAPVSSSKTISYEEYSKVSEEERLAASEQFGVPDLVIPQPNKIRMRLRFAKVLVEAMNDKKDKGSIKVTKLRGPSTCSLRLLQNQTRLTVVEQSPSHANCRFQVELQTSESSEIALQLDKGSVNMKNWSEDVSLRLGSGEIDFENIGNISIECDDCIVSGSEVSGKVKYALKTGNIGVEGLTQSVEGNTSGDTIMKWKKLNPGSRISLLSKAGDIVVTIPNKTPLSLDLKIPKGEFFTNLGPSDVVLNSQEMKSGVPASITAEVGNVRIIH